MKKVHQFAALEMLEARTLLSAGPWKPGHPSSSQHGQLSSLDATFAYQPEPELDDLETRGRSRYFNLIPGLKLVFEGEDEGEELRLVITVTNQTRVVDGVRTRVVKEVETADGELVEISWNYVAIHEDTKDVFYFGEDVDIYENGQVVSHDGAWRSGVNGARFGLLMPGDPEVGMTFFQERAPGVALDEAEIVRTNARVRVPAGTFRDCLKVEETTVLEPGAVSVKFHAPGIGLLVDGVLELVRFSF
jgi:hypothetical protein